MEQQIADLLRQNQDLIRVLQIRDDSHSHKVTVQFDKFDEENENFDSFIERFETYLDVQNVPIANQAKVFVSSLSAKLYQLLKNLLAPDIPSDQMLDKLKDALKKHLTPKPLIIPSRHKLLNRKQTEGEGISTYIAELRALAMNCDYDKDMLSIMLRDVFVSGLRDKMILDRLFEEDNINLEKTLNIALAMEKAFRGTNDIMGRAINSMKTFKKHMDKNPILQKSRKKTLYCSRCTGTNHAKENCRFISSKCNFCGKIGHIKQACFASKRQMRNRLNKNRVRTVPFALKGRVENEIDRLEKEGIIEKVDSSEWATPVVPVVKSDGSIRLCADYSVTLNPNLIVPQHPLPRLDEIFATIANPLNNLTRKNVRFLWSKDCQVAFEQIKKEICSPKILVHYDPSLPLTLASDASPVGIGCVLSHVYPDGSERPIALSSRLPKTSEELEVKDDITIFQMSQIEALPVTSKELRQETSKDIELGPLLRALREGKDLQGREAQYTIEDGCIMYGQRVCIPRKFRKNVLEELHADT
ncbi:transposon Tf2-6 polyprotein [Trichonephila clavipes]|nr:transposon Tf2-6 polyprotein [Trichonephila clavipes]